MTNDQKETKTEYRHDEIAYEWLVRNHLSSFIPDLTTGENLEDGDIDRTAETIAQRAYDLSRDRLHNLYDRYHDGYHTPCSLWKTVTLSREAKDALFPRLDGKDEELAVQVTSNIFKGMKYHIFNLASFSGGILMRIVEDSKIDPVHDSLPLPLWPLVLERAWKNEPNGRNRHDGIRNAIRVYCLLRNSPSLYMQIGK